MKETFVWNQDFETKFEAVDNQHHHLIDLINRFSEQVMQKSATAADLNQLFSEMYDYTQYHFTEEETLMEKSGLHPQFIKDHRNIHNAFCQQLDFMKSHLKMDSQSACESVLDFLYQWLGHHILGQDQSMARQIASIRAGETAEAALMKETETDNQDRVEPLLDALNNMMHLLTSQYQEISNMNTHLEEMVESRTESLRQANEKLKTVSLTDNLTNLPNRRHAMLKLKDFWQETDEAKLPLSCMMIDADYFKEVNDTYGHDAGDTVLCELARTLLHSARNDDTVSRLGGDEFFVICPNTDLAGCRKLADELLNKVKALKVSTGSGHWQSSVSIGIAEKVTGMQEPDDLIKLSDQSLYMAKGNGRGCVQSIQDTV